MSDLKHTALYELHRQCGANMVPFAGYSMPLNYRSGPLKEHRATRESAGLFDVSHMGQILVRPRDGMIARTARNLESLMPVELENLPVGRQRYALLTTANGCIIDDLIVARWNEYFGLVVNAATKHSDTSHLQRSMGADSDVSLLNDRSMLALQGPKSHAVLRAALGSLPQMRFMEVCSLPSRFGELWIARSGYTGEDGFEISVPDAEAENLARALLDREDVTFVGLAARDSLRLEAGYSLYGADIDTTTTVVEAGLAWSVSKSRRAGGSKEGGFPGAELISRQMAEGPPRRMVGLLPHGRILVRAGHKLFADRDGSVQVGVVTSGGFGATVSHPVAMGYVDAGITSDTTLYFRARGKLQPLGITSRQFTKTNLHKG